MPFPFIALAISIAFTFLSALLTPKPKTKATSLADFDVPTATEDRPKPMWVGTVRHKSPNCTWYGDYSTKPIKKGGGIMTLGLTTLVGYKYFLGFDLNLGWGQLDEIIRIGIDDKEAWTGSVSSGTITIDKPELFGGEAAGSNNGGFQASVVVYNGNGTQTADPYLIAKSGATPAYKNDVHLVFKGLTSGGAYIGNSTSLPAIDFDARRCPNQLGVTGGKHIIDTYDANPVCALYEFMTRPKNQFGGGYSPSQFNTANWIAAANAVYAEGLGISRMFDSVSDVESVISDYLQLLDGVINISMTTGQFELVLARNDYDPDTIPVFDRDSVVEVVSFKRGSWIDTFNETRLSYIDRTQGFESIPVAAQDAANAAGQSEVRSTTVSIPGISNPTVANKVVFRELRPVSIPLATLTIKVNRSGFGLYGGGVFKWDDLVDFGVESLIFRVAEVDTGTLSSNIIQITAVQDVFSLGNAAYLPPQTSSWIEPSTIASAVTDQQIIEQPRFFHQTDFTRVLSIAKAADGAQASYDLHVKESTATAYVQRLSEVSYTPKGTLTGDYASTQYNTSSALIVTPVSQMSDLPAAVNVADIKQGSGLILIGGEMLAYESYTINGSGNYVFNGVWGGLFDTALAKHTTGDVVWFFTNGAGVLTDNFGALATINAKLTSHGSDGVFDITSATSTSVATVNRSVRPIRPANITIQGTAYNAAIPATGNDITFGWTRRTRSATIVRKDSDADEVELNVTTTIKVYNGAGVLLATHSGLTGTSWVYTAAMQTADVANVNQLVFVIYSEGFGVTSYQAAIISTARPTFTASTTLPTFTPSGAYTSPIAGNTISGVSISNTPDSTHTLPVYDPTTGAVTWSSTFATVTVVTSSLANNASQDLTAALGKSYLITKVQADKDCWIRVYSDASYRTLDAARVITADPTGEHGVIADLYPVAANLVLDLAPMLSGSNADRSSNAAINIQNLSGSTGTVTVTFTVIKLEA